VRNHWDITRISSIPFASMQNFKPPNNCIYNILFQGELFLGVGRMAKCVIDYIRNGSSIPTLDYAAPPDSTNPGQLITTLRQGTLNLHISFSSLSVLNNHRIWLAAVSNGGLLLGHLLERAYVCALTIAISVSDLLSVPSVASRMSCAGLAIEAARLLGLSADLSFCRPPDLPLAKDLLSKLLPLLEATPDGAILLEDQLPCYSELVRKSPISMQPRWLEDSVAVSKLLTLMPLISACLSSVRSSELPSVTSKLLPYAFLLIRHPQVLWKA